MLGPVTRWPNRALNGSTSLLQRALLPAFRAHSAPRNSMARRSQSVHRSRLRKARCGLVRGRLGLVVNAGSPSRSLERCRSSSKMSMAQSFSGYSRSCALRRHPLCTSRTGALLSKASTSVGERPPRPAHQLGRTYRATFGARSMPGEAWATPPGPCRCLRSRPSSEEGTRSFRVPQRASAPSACTQSARHVVGPQALQASERTAQRYISGLTALRATGFKTSPGCTFKTSPCVPAPRAHMFQHVCAWCRYSPGR